TSSQMPMRSTALPPSGLSAGIVPRSSPPRQTKLDGKSAKFYTPRPCRAKAALCRAENDRPVCPCGPGGLLLKQRAPGPGKDGTQYAHGEKPLQILSGGEKPLRRALRGGPGGEKRRVCGGDGALRLRQD